MRALIVDAGDGVGALAAVRQLARAGWRVSVAAPTRTLAARSRHSRQWAPLPALSEDPDRFVAAVAGAADAAVVFPAGDAEVLLLSAQRDRLGDAVFPYPAHAVVADLFDKWTLTRAAYSEGLATPPTESLVEGGAPTLAPPLIVKARRHWQPRGATLRLEATRCESVEETDAAVAAVRGAGGEPIVQQAVEGELASVVLARWRGRLLGAHQQHAERIEPPLVGSSVRAVTDPVDDDLLARCIALLDRVGYDSGLVQLEFLSGADGRFRLIDANPRIYGSLALATEAGWNPLDLLGRAANGGPPRPVVHGAEGARYHWLEADLRSLIRGGARAVPGEAVGTARWSAASAPRFLDDLDPLPRLTSATRLVNGLARRRVRATDPLEPAVVPVHFVSSHAALGGSERYLERVIAGLGPAWVGSIVALEHGPAVTRLASAAGVRVEVLATGARAVDIARSALRLRRIVWRTPAGPIHANGVKAAVVASLAADRRHPMVWVKHDIAQPGVAGAWAAIRSTRIVGVSSFVLETLPARARGRAEVLHFGLEERTVDRAAARRRLDSLLAGAGAGGGRPVVALVGRLDPGKGHEDALEAWAQAQAQGDLPAGARLAFIGGDDKAHPGHRAHLEARAAALGVIDTVVFTGQQPAADELIAGSDVVLVPSRPQPNGLGAEGLPLAALEALDAAVPVIGYDVGGLPEALGPCGVLVPPGDIDGIRDAVVALCVDPDRRAALASDGPARIRSSFSYPTLLDGLRRVYRDVLAT